MIDYEARIYEARIEMLKDYIAFYESLSEYDWYAQKRVKEINEEIEQYLKEVKKVRLSNE